MALISNLLSNAKSPFYFAKIKIIHKLYLFTNLYYLWPFNCNCLYVFKKLKNCLQSVFYLQFYIGNPKYSIERPIEGLGKIHTIFVYEC